MSPYRASLAPVVLDVVPGIEREVIRRPPRDMRSEAMRARRLTLHEVPEGDAAGRAGDRGDALFAGAGALAHDHAMALQTDRGVGSQRCQGWRSLKRAPRDCRQQW